MSYDSDEPLLASPSGLLRIPQRCVHPVEDVEEELFLLYTFRHAKDDDLGILEQRSDKVYLCFEMTLPANEKKRENAPREISLYIYQNVRGM